jgi:hypothetical protein
MEDIWNLDILGCPITSGDRVAYAVRRGNHALLRTGLVVGLSDSRKCVLIDADGSVRTSIVPVGNMVVVGRVEG